MKALSLFLFFFKFQWPGIFHIQWEVKNYLMKSMKRNVSRTCEEEKNKTTATKCRARKWGIWLLAKELVCDFLDLTTCNYRGCTCRLQGPPDSHMDSALPSPKGVAVKDSSKDFEFALKLQMKVEKTDILTMLYLSNLEYITIYFSLSSIINDLQFSAEISNNMLVIHLNILLLILLYIAF